jgi:type II secretory pathway predicted ATPase ExeA
LDKRIGTRFSIRAMDLGESAVYLRHHLASARREEPLFADDAVARLVSRTDFPGRSTAPTPRRSSRRPPRTRISSMTRVRKRPPTS